MNKKVCLLALSLLVAGCAGKQEQQPNANVSNAVNEFNEFASQNEFYFEFDKSNVKNQKLVKNYVAKINNLGNATLNVGGYCDNKGTAKYNDALGMRRAKAVASKLKENGVKKNVKIKVVSYGDSKYTKYVNDVVENDGKNRKVAIVAE